MSGDLYYLIAFLIAHTVVLWSTPLVRTVGLKSGYVDKPNERKVHESPWFDWGEFRFLSAL